ncbi:SHOCT domain-containing protein [Marinobacter sp. TBZ242]|uniref:SHOCT domain-containing protein n=1 Tax=Marinobacter azerbaijanicus TaxID=3050455 RepID=A0ABT7IC84_9GAMM|nr:SHOCT domain-containing protein [Marinobacter sp. TBZ242]MDL0431771.1 SHOCT domain-containing protein [Marinobacter sp. TBZ242]
MGPEHFGWGGWWLFPVVMPIVMVVVLGILIYFVFGRGGPRPPWSNDFDGSSSHHKDSESAMEILKKRYARGEITREEFEEIKKDLQS